MKIKTFFNTIFILIIIGFLTFVFYLGIEQFNLDENTYAVIYTKTSGWKDETVSSNKFSWSFEKVIPTIYKMHKFTIEKKNFNLNSTTPMPSYDLYAEFNDIPKEQFTYRYNVNFNYKLDRSNLVKLVKSGTFTEETFEAWESKQIKILSQQISSYIQSQVLKTESTISIKPEEVLSYLTTFHKHYIIENFIIDLTPPDLELYTISKNRYINMINIKMETEKEYLQDKLKSQNSEILKLELLKKYGEVFSEYPIMIEFMKVDKDNSFDLAKFNDFIEHQNQN